MGSSAETTDSFRGKGTIRRVTKNTCTWKYVQHVYESFEGFVFTTHKSNDPTRDDSTFSRLLRFRMLTVRRRSLLSG